MILRTLSLKNFKQYGSLELPFQEGLTGIVGRNGAGKSSIFEAVLICLFGDIRGDKKLMRSSWAKEKAVVSLSLTFEVQNKTYKVLREYRGKILTHHAHLYDHADTALATGATPVTKEIERLIGMDKDAFTRSIFSGQKELGEISNTKGEERRKMVRKMVGLDKLDKIQNLVREDRNSAKNQIKGKSGLLFSESELKEKETELKTNQKELDKQNKVLEKTEKKATEKQQKYAAASKLFEEQRLLYKQYRDILEKLTKFEGLDEGLQNQMLSADKRIASLKTLQVDLKKQEPEAKAFEKQKEELAQVEIQKEQFEKAQRLQQQLEQFGKQSTDIQTQLKKVENIPERIKKGEQYIADFENKLKKSQEEIKIQDGHLKKLSSELGAINSRIKERENQIKQIKELGKDAECPTCFQPMIDRYEETLTRFQKEIQQYTLKEQTEINTAIERLDKERQVTNSELEKQQAAIQNGKGILATLLEKKKQEEQLISQQQKLQESIKEGQTQLKNLGKIDFDPKNHAFLKQQINTFEPTYFKYLSQRDDVAKLPEEVEAKAKLKERSKKGKELIKEKKQELKTLRFSEKAHQKADETKKTLENERDEVLALLSQQKEAVFTIKTTIQAVEGTLKHQQHVKTDIQEQQDDLLHLESLDAAFTKFKSKALDKVRPIIRQHASSLFNEITKGRYESITVNENFEFFISDNGKDYPITRFSGGEIDLANLCLRIGISKAISELSGSSAAMSLLCFDEIFGSQDEDRRFEILRAFDLLKEQYRQIYIVSHIESIKDYFPNILQVSKRQAGSEVEWL